jgi:hypothetical protein
MFGIDINAKQVTQDELAQILIGLDKKGMVPVSITTVTKQQSRKPTGFERFELEGYSGKGGQTYFCRVSQSNGNIGINYTDKVNREREKQGVDPDFVAKKSPYDFITEGVRKKADTHYLFYFPRNAAADFEPVITGIDESTNTLRIVDEEEIEDVLPAKTEAESPGRQELAVGTEVKPRTVSFGSIAAIKVDGQSYVVKDIDDFRLKSFMIAFE